MNASERSAATFGESCSNAGKIFKLAGVPLKKLQAFAHAVKQNCTEAKQKRRGALPPPFPLAILSFTHSHVCCALTWRSLGEQPAEQAAEAGLRGDHAVPEGGHPGVGEDAGDARQGKGQIQPGKHTRCRRTRYTHRAVQNTCVNASQKCLPSAPSHQRVGKHCLKLHV